MTRWMSRNKLDLCLGIGVCLLTLVIAVYWAPRGFHFGFVDLGHDGYQLRQVADLSQGGVIFRDTFDQYGPLNGYLDTLGFIALGRRLLSIKWFICGWYALSAALLYALGRRWLSPGMAACSVLVWLGLAPFYRHGIMISPHAATVSVQALAFLLIWKPEAVEGRGSRLVAVGALAGIAWALKQSYGVLFFGGLLAFALTLGLSRRLTWRRALRMSALMGLGFAGVVVSTLALLWSAGALHDWYLQTIAFPQGIYLAGGTWAAFRSTITDFRQLQADADGYWHIIRGLVIGAGLLALFRRQMSGAWLLSGAVTAALWLGAYPSANYMHQWWTTSLSILPFIVIVWTISERLPARSLVTVFAVGALVMPGLVDRVSIIGPRAQGLSQVIESPDVLRGMRTSMAGQRIFRAFDQELSTYVRQHSGTKIRSLESDMTPWSVLLLSFVPDNTRPGPVYWNEPVLATSTYPNYWTALQTEIARDRPLLVDHVRGTFAPKTLPNYALRLAAQSDYGFWYLYEPADGVLPLVFLNAKGEPSSAASAGKASQASVDRANRRIAQHQPHIQESLSGAPLYVFPATLTASRVLLDRIVPIADTPLLRAKAVTGLSAGRWTVDGQIEDRYSYVLQFPVAHKEQGAIFAVRGEVVSGGVSIGVTQGGQWIAFLNVTKPGPFVVALQMPAAGEYGVTVANCVESQPHNLLGLVRRPVLENHFSVVQAGWLEQTRPRR